MPVTGWKLISKRRILRCYLLPRWRDAVTDHGPLDARALRHTLPPPQANAAVIGHAGDSEGLEALAVAMDGSTAGGHIPARIAHDLREQLGKPAVPAGLHGRGACCTGAGISRYAVPIGGGTTNIMPGAFLPCHLTAAAVHSRSCVSHI